MRTLFLQALLDFLHKLYLISAEINLSIYQ